MRLAVAAVALLCIALPPPLFAQPPVLRWWGELGYDYREEHFEEQSDSMEHTGLLRLNAATYLFEPWLATLDGGLGFVLRETERGGDTTDSEQVLGNATLRVLPRSRYPLEFFAEQTDSRTDSDLIGSDIELTRYGFLQRYTTEAGSAMRLRFEHTDRTNTNRLRNGEEQEQRDLADLWQAGFNTSFGPHSVIVDASYNELEQPDTDDMSTTEFASLRHTYRPGPRLSAEDLLTWNATDFDRGAGMFDTRTAQLSTFARWRPPTERPSRLSTTLRVLDRESQFDGSTSESDSVTGTVGGTYEWSERLVSNASVGANAVETNNQQSSSSFQTANLVYSSQIYRVIGVDASYFGQADVRNNNEESGAVQSAGLQAGYDLSRSLPNGGNSSVQLQAGQSAATVEDSEGFMSNTLVSRASAAWLNRVDSTSAMARLSLSDSRTYADGPGAEGVEGEFQLVNLQASVNQRFDVRRQLSANLTVQATRSEREAAASDSRNGDWKPTAALDLTYQDIQFLGVPRLRFRSTLRFLSDSYFPELDEVDEPEGRSDRQWENRLDYTIGRLQLRAIARLSEIRDEEQALLLFQVRRLIGDI